MIFPKAKIEIILLFDPNSGVASHCFPKGDVVNGGRGMASEYLNSNPDYVV